MNLFLKIISFAGLLLTVAPSVFVFYQMMTIETHKIIALIGTILWIATAPFWINEKRHQDAQ